jgi:AraC family transcriptional regulator
MDYIRENASANLTLEELAGHFDDTPYVFLRRFRRVAGIPPHRYQIQCRVERARRLIERGMPLPEVALETGFCDQSHLNRRFREIFGVAPGAYGSAMRCFSG